MEYNKIYCGDCLELIHQVDDESVDMIFCDYPFNSQDGKTDYVDFIDKLSMGFYRVLKPDCVLLIVNNPANIYKTRYCYEQFTHRDSVALIRKGSLRPAWMFGFQHNYLMTFMKGDNKKVKWNGPKKNHDKSFLTDVIEYQNGYRGKGKNWHPQAMPLPLVKTLVGLYSDEGDIVLDPFFGAGTTGVACVELKRNYIGIEYNEKYAIMAKERIDNMVLNG